MEIRAALEQVRLARDSRNPGAEGMRFAGGFKGRNLRYIIASLDKDLASLMDKLVILLWAMAATVNQSVDIQTDP